MSQANLNPNPAPTEPPRRYDLAQHSKKPFFSGAKMLASVALSALALAASALGGSILLVTGPPPDFHKLLTRPASEGSAGNAASEKASVSNVAPAPEKSVQVKISDLMSDYQKRWNEGTFPAELATSDFHARDMDGKVLKSKSQYYSADHEIVNLRVARIVQISLDEVAVTAYELIRRDEGIKSWFSNAGGTAQNGDLVFEIVVENEYRLINSGGWKVKSREWKRQTPYLIQQKGEQVQEQQMDEGTIQFDDLRPSRESLEPSYTEIAQQLQVGGLTTDFFPGSYRVSFDSGGTVTRYELEARLSKLHLNVKDLLVNFTIDSVEQTGPASAEAVVRFSASFVPKDSKAGNTYVAVWRDRDTWTRPSDTSAKWARTATKRILRSPIWQHYETKEPKWTSEAFPATGTADSSDALGQGGNYIE